MVLTPSVSLLQFTTAKFPNRLYGIIILNHVLFVVLLSTRVLILIDSFYRNKKRNHLFFFRCLWSLDLLIQLSDLVKANEVSMFSCSSNQSWKHDFKDITEV